MPLQFCMASHPWRTLSCLPSGREIRFVFLLFLLFSFFGMKTSKAPCVFGIRLNWVVRFTSLSFCHRRKKKRCPSSRSLGGAQIRFRRVEEERNLFLVPGLEPTFLSCPACRLVTVMAEPFFGDLGIEETIILKWILEREHRVRIYTFQDMVEWSPIPALYGVQINDFLQKACVLCLVFLRWYQMSSV